MDRLKTPEAAPERAVHTALREGRAPTFDPSGCNIRVFHSARHPASGAEIDLSAVRLEERADLVGLGYASPNHVRPRDELLVFRSILALPRDFLSDDRKTGPRDRKGVSRRSPLSQARYRAADAVAKAAQDLMHISPKKFVWRFP